MAHAARNTVSKDLFHHPLAQHRQLAFTSIGRGYISSQAKWTPVAMADTQATTFFWFPLWAGKNSG